MRLIRNAHLSLGCCAGTTSTAATAFDVLATWSVINWTKRIKLGYTVVWKMIPPHHATDRPTEDCSSTLKLIWVYFICFFFPSRFFLFFFSPSTFVSSNERGARGTTNTDKLLLLYEQYRSPRAVTTSVYLYPSCILFVCYCTMIFYCFFFFFFGLTVKCGFARLLLFHAVPSRSSYNNIMSTELHPILYWSF